MGAGKTAVGEECAGRLDRLFLDTDALVTSEAAASIPEIFEREGEDAFRDRERRAVADACASAEPAVIACGGGAVIDADNRRRMRDAGLVVWLDAPPDVLAQRVEDGSGRPLLSAGEPPDVLADFALARAATYEDVADVVIDTAGLDVAEVADLVLEAVAAEASR